MELAPSTNKLEVKTTQTMIDRIESTHGIKPERLLGDTVYGAAENLGYLVNEKGIEPHVPVIDKTQRGDGIKKANTIIYRSSEIDCKLCPLKQQCCPITLNRKIVRSIHEGAREVRISASRHPSDPDKEDFRKCALIYR